MLMRLGLLMLFIATSIFAKSELSDYDLSLTYKGAFSDEDSHVENYSLYGLSVHKKLDLKNKIGLYTSFGEVKYDNRDGDRSTVNKVGLDYQWYFFTNDYIKGYATSALSYQGYSKPMFTRSSELLLSYGAGSKYTIYGNMDIGVSIQKNLGFKSGESELLAGVAIGYNFYTKKKATPSDNFDKLIKKSQEYYSLNMYDRALFEVGEAIRARPDNPLGYKLRGSIYYKMGKSDLAKKSWKTAGLLEAQSLNKIKQRLIIKEED
jgi:tetratricopeptide (TPR) repeat protein